LENKKKIQLQIPDEIIRNYCVDFNHYDFGVYALLRYAHFRNPNKDKDKLEINHKFMMNKLFINDSRTLKKSLNKLYKYGFIEEEIKRLPRNGILKLEFNHSPFKTKSFTQLPTSLINKIEQIGLIGYRLIYYYESYINRKDVISKQFCFVGQDTISSELNINKETIKKYNDILKKSKLVTIKKHKLEFDGYDDLDNIVFNKYNNHYYVHIDKM
jgi:predicted transcriptional regulator